MAISTGKDARKRLGTRAACRRAKGRKGQRKSFGRLPYSVVAGTAEAFIRKGA